MLGCYGSTENLSPEIDAMAEEGVVFEYALSQTSWTRPSIGSMLTSRYPRSIGIYDEKFDILQQQLVTLPEILQDEGYVTYGITANPNTNAVFHFDQGFDEYRDSSVVWSWMSPEDGQLTHERGKNALPRSADVFQAVIEFVRSSERRPFFVLITVMEAHSPYLVREEYAQRFPTGNLEGLTEEEQVLTRLKAGTRAAVRQLSADVDQFIRALSEMPGLENTLLVLTSDHGQGLDDHPDVERSTFHGNLLYDSQVHVPLILHHLGQTALPSGRIGRTVRLMDLMPTVLTVAGIESPRRLQGRSLVPLILNQSPPADQPEAFFLEAGWRDVDKAAVYRGVWKYFENNDGWRGLNGRELQPAGIRENGVKTDVIEEHPEVARRLKTLLDEWRSRYAETPSVQPDARPSDREIEQLKSLGYMN